MHNQYRLSGNCGSRYVIFLYWLAEYWFEIQLMRVCALPTCIAWINSLLFVFFFFLIFVFSRTWQKRNERNETKTIKRYNQIRQTSRMQIRFKWCFFFEQIHLSSVSLFRSCLVTSNPNRKISALDCIGVFYCYLIVKSTANKQQTNKKWHIDFDLEM